MKSKLLVVTDVIVLTKIDSRALKDLKSTITRRPKKQKFESCDISSTYSKVGNTFGHGKFVDKTASKILVTSGHTSGIICEWCRLSIESVAVGIPLNYTRKKRVAKNGKRKIVEFIYEFDVTGNYCDFACCLAEIDMMLDKYDKSKISTYDNSRKYLLLMYVLNTGGKTALKKRRDRGLLKVNGGSLTREEYRDQDYDYIEIGAVVQRRITKIYKRVEKF